MRRHQQQPHRNRRSAILHGYNLRQPASRQQSTLARRTELQHLDDHAILEIFRWLPIESLAAVSATGQRFHDIARTAFKIYHGHRPLSLGIVLRYYSRIALNGHNVSREKLRQVLSYFGDLIQSIVISGNGRTRDRRILPLLKLLCAHCSGGTLRSLRLSLVNLRWDKLASSHEFFDRLGALSVHDSSLELNRLFGTAPALTSLSVFLDVLHSMSGTVHFPALIELAVTVNTPLTLLPLEAKVTAFLHRHRQVKVVSVSCGLYHSNDAVLEAISHWETVECLFIWAFCILPSIGAMLTKSASTETLRQLFIKVHHRRHVAAFDFLSSLGRFRRLQRLDVTADGGGQQMAKLPDLRALEELVWLMDCTKEELVELVERRLPRLKRLSLRDNVIDADTFQRLFMVYRPRGHALIVKICQPDRPRMGGATGYGPRIHYDFAGIEGDPHAASNYLQVYYH